MPERSRVTTPERSGATAAERSGAAAAERSGASATAAERSGPTAARLILNAAPTPIGAARGVAAAMLASAALGTASLTVAVPSAAHGGVGTLDIVTRADNRVQPVYDKDGRRWVIGSPGQEYAIRVCNTTGSRVLAVTSVDGVNVLSGETASPSQSGYVLSAYECTEIYGWRKNLSSVAAFYFTELPDAYATRTGRPDNVGVIGVAFFREQVPPAVMRETQKLAAERNESRSSVPSEAPASPRGDAPAARQESAASGGSAAKRLADAASAPVISAITPAPAPAPSLGTGHGRREASFVQTTRFERESPTPNQTLVIHYDRRENLIAMGILPPPAVARSAEPFPAWTPRFVPDPPR